VHLAGLRDTGEVDTWVNIRDREERGVEANLTLRQSFIIKEEQANIGGSMDHLCSNARLSD